VLFKPLEKAELMEGERMEIEIKRFISHERIAISLLVL
jgi:predicted DNA-binding antitoxin AbrB/MazE fold protein